jgi:hypothetical protein
LSVDLTSQDITEAPLMYQVPNTMFTTVSVALLLFPFYNVFDNKNKSSQSNTILLYHSTVSPTNPWSDNPQTCDPVNNTNLQIKTIKDVKNPLWNAGFTNIQNTGSDSEIVSGIKAYKSYQTAIGAQTYVNWVANGMYDLAVYKNEA